MGGDTGGSAERNQSLWMLTDPPQDRFPPLVSDVDVDVCVVGAGISGLMTAYHLKRSGARVVVLERDRVGTGVTGFTTGKVTSLHGLVYAGLEERYSRDVAAIYGDANEAGVHAVRAIAAEHAIDCDLATMPAYTYTDRDGTVAAIEAEVEAARRAGLPASLVTQTDLPFEVRAAVRFDSQLHFHPRRFLDGVASVVAEIHERTTATDVSEEDGRCVVTTPRAKVRADRVVLATLIPFVNTGLFFAKAHPESSYAIASRFDDPPHGMYLSADLPVRSIRPHLSADASWLIVGGEHHKVGQHDDDTNKHYDALESFASERFSMRPQMRWSASDFIPADDLPYVGRASGRTERIYVITGMKKLGLSTGSFAGILIADLIAGRVNPWADVFDASRIDPKRAGTRLVKENLNVATRLVGDRLADIHPRDADDLQPGEGDIVEVGSETVAAYRDESGALHTLSPVCTHLGCHVRFNAAERSWDCPCHGSRFATDGSVLRGPAVDPLPEVSAAERS